MPAPVRRPAIDSHFFPSSHAHTADLKLAYAVEQGLEAALLVGSPGLGKTTILRRALARAAAANNAVVDIFFPRLDAEELLAFIDTELSLQADARHHDGEPRLHRIASSVRKLAEAGRGVVIVIDDAHLLPGVAFETLQLLLNLRERESVRITVLLAGQTALLANLAKVSAFAQRVAVTAALAPMHRDETAAYARHRLAASASNAPAFDEASLDALQEHSAGVPRTANRLCDIAILIAAADRRELITAAAVTAAAQECSTFLRDAA
jgi:general secretion pathway protein A